MKIAIPLTGGVLSTHFGHCEEFAVLEIDEQSKQILEKSLHKAPPHEPGALPAWLATFGVNLIIAGGMGSRAQNLFADNGISVIIGAPSKSPEELASMCVAGTLVSGDNVCDH